MTYDPGHNQQFPFEAFVRQRYQAVRARKTFDISTIFQLAALIFVLGFVTFILLLIIFVLSMVLIISPLLLVVSMIQRAGGAQQEPQSPFDDPPDAARSERITIIDMEPEDRR